MPIDSVLEDFIGKAAEKYNVPKELLTNIILEEKLQRYRREGDKGPIIDKIAGMLQDMVTK